MHTPIWSFFLYFPVGTMPPAPLWRCWDGAVAPRALAAAEAEARLLWRLAGGARDDPSARTFWIAADEDPRCCLEQLALAIARFHFSNASAWRRVLGLEFWVQLRTPEDPPPKQGLEFHYDKDEAAVEMWDIWSHPELATVTYLTSSGAPLVVFSTRSVETGASSDEDNGAAAGPTMPCRANRSTGSATPSPAAALVCFPRAARHIAFEGNLLHGIPSELLHLEDGGGASRPRGRAGHGPSRGGRAAAQAVKRRRLSSSSEYAGMGPAGPLADRPRDRLSLLVNVWTSHWPTDVRRMTGSLVAKLRACSPCSSKPPKRPLALRRSMRTPQMPRALTVVIGKGSTLKDELRRNTMHKLSEHLAGDTGLLPVPALLRARRAAVASGPRNGGVLALRYRWAAMAKRGGPG
mmetsp:Transcript_120508/g.336230  ORF Transcript_120508/g.336230 Transcript_120508/m.336230 type:complete len:407 (+) Transcript_120508:2-1222(+)